jgi:hypothetical protein
MIRRRRVRQSYAAPCGYFHFSDSQHRSISGFGDGDCVRLKDDKGDVWRGTAEVRDDRSVFYRFRNGSGKVISGVSDGYGILLRDERGQMWRGYVF